MAGSVDFLQALAEAHDWCEALGHASVQARHCRLVSDPAYPLVWSANHASGVRAATPDAIEETLADIQAAFPRSPCWVVDSDAFTPAPFLARLALDGWQEQPAVILMSLDEAVAAAEVPGLEIVPVRANAARDELRRLHRRDLEEGGRTGAPLSDEVIDGLFEGLQSKAAAGRVLLGRIDGRACAYAMALPAPGGFGFIDDVFTAPEFRRRGVAAAMVAACVAYLRDEGARTSFLTALASAPPKRIYARLGFRPRMLARRWLWHAPPGAPDHPPTVSA